MKQKSTTQNTNQMEPANNLSVGDIITVYRTDCGGRRIPQNERQYVTEDEYFYRAKVVSLCPERRYNFVRVIKNDGTLVTKRRKAYKSKSFTTQN